MVVEQDSAGTRRLGGEEEPTGRSPAQPLWVRAERGALRCEAETIAVGSKGNCGRSRMRS
jgi:hypothetical protein